MIFVMIPRLISSWMLLAVGLAAIITGDAILDGMILIGISQLLMKE